MYWKSEKKLVKQQYLLYMSPQYGELRPTSGWDPFVSLAGTFNGFRVLAALLHGTLVVGVSQTAALNRGRHLYSAGRPSRWALTHILVCHLVMWKLMRHDIPACLDLEHFYLLMSIQACLMLCHSTTFSLVYHMFPSSISSALCVQQNFFFCKMPLIKENVLLTSLQRSDSYCDIPVEL